MNVKVLEKSKDKLKIEMDDLTLINLLNENIWKQRIQYSAYGVDHPYLSRPVLTVKAKQPKKSIIDAADRIIDDVKELKKHVSRALK